MSPNPVAAYLLFAFLTAVVGAPGAPAQADTSEAESDPSQDYRFSSDWFSKRIPEWSEFLGDLRGNPGLRYLEIGVFEGRSALWMLENILTHPESRMTAIDIFAGDYYVVFLQNLIKSGQLDKVKIVKESSQSALRRETPDSYDIVYIDGSHVTADVLVDTVLSWQVLKTGGFLIFDDYGLQRARRRNINPKIAIDAFLRVFDGHYEEIHRGYQLTVRKIK